MRRIAVIAGLVLATAARAHAAPCSQSGPGGGPLPNPIYLQVGDTQEPLLKSLGADLANEGSPITFVYKTSGSCTNIDAIRNNTLLVAGATMKYIPAGYDPANAPPTCTLDGDTALDVANSALFVTACTTDAPPAEVVEERGPNQAYVFAVPEASTEEAITAEEAYCTFGFGDASNQTAWHDQQQMQIRTVTKSTLLALAAAIGVPAAAWNGVRNDTSDQVVSGLQTSTAPGSAIGILGAEVYDRHRDTLDSLAFQAYGQWNAYYPDSSASATDKQNVRDGHYFAWSPTIWMLRTDDPSYDDARYVVDLILGRQTPADFDPLANEVSLGLVPACAMSVTRDFEGGPLAPYEDAAPCGCFYDSVATSTTCDACDDLTPCAAGTCRHGYCEEQ
jgi:hypothetical protein